MFLLRRRNQGAEAGFGWDPMYNAAISSFRRKSAFQLCFQNSCSHEVRVRTSNIANRSVMKEIIFASKSLCYAFDKICSFITSYKIWIAWRSVNNKETWLLSRNEISKVFFVHMAKCYVNQCKISVILKQKLPWENLSRLSECPYLQRRGTSTLNIMWTALLVNKLLWLFSWLGKNREIKVAHIKIPVLVIRG